MPETANISQLRRDIDSGRTGDKVAAPDPAAAPLGTDDEAAGTTLSSEVVEMAQKEELRAGTEAAEKPAQMSGTTIYLIVMGGFFQLMGAGGRVVTAPQLAPRHLAPRSGPKSGSD